MSEHEAFTQCANVGERTPPLSQMDKGAVSGLLRASKNQNLMGNNRMSTACAA